MSAGVSRLELVRLTKRFGGFPAVDALDIAVDSGEFVTLLGPSGSGKTTILRMIAGFETPTSGRILLDGRDVSALPPGKRGIGFVFQHYALFPHMTAAENVAYPLRLRRIPRAERRRRVERALALVRLEGLGSRRPAELSGGQQQRVALARALVFGPSVLLMDEPLGALDRTLRRELEQELRAIHRETGVTVLYVTHDREEALVLSDRIGILRDGRLLQHGVPAELYERPCDAFVAQFFGECNLFPVRVVEADGELRWALADEPGDRSRAWIGEAPRVERQAGRWFLLLRAGRLRVGPVGDAVVSARVDDVFYLGERVRLRCVSLGAGVLVAEGPAHEMPPVRRGQSVELGFEIVDARLIPEGDPGPARPLAPQQAEIDSSFRLAAAPEPGRVAT